jgi:hypothetical protein
MSKVLHILGDSYCCNFNARARGLTGQLSYHRYPETDEFNSNHLWMNIVAKNFGFDKVENLSSPGCSLYYIVNKLLELHGEGDLKNITHFIIGLTTTARFDIKNRLEDLVNIIESDNNLATVYFNKLFNHLESVNGVLPIVMKSILDQHDCKVIYLNNMFGGHDHYDVIRKMMGENYIPISVSEREYEYNESSNYPTHFSIKGNQDYAKTVIKSIKSLW